MPRGRKTKKDEDDDIIEDAEEETPKPKKKSGSKRAAPKKSNKKAKEAKEAKEDTGSDQDDGGDEDDELSDLDVNDTDDNAQDESLTSRPIQKTPKKVIDPETPVGDLKTEDILSYLIQRGADSLNPQLKHGALDLLHRLTGRRRRQPPPRNQGNFRPPFGGPNPNFVSRGSHPFRGRGGGPGQRGPPRNANNNPQEQIYQDV